MYILKWIAAVTIIFGFVIFNIQFTPLVFNVASKTPEAKNSAEIETALKRLEKVTAKISAIAPQKTEPNIKIVSFAANHYICTNSDGNKTYQDKPCTKNELEVIFKEKTNSTIELHPKANGNYFVSGTINNHPVEFLIDTGASFLALSKQNAAIYNITGCAHGTTTTANGIIEICIATAAQITIGKFQLNNVTITILPNLSNPLLGMNVLKQFKIEQTNNLMRISKE